MIDFTRQSDLINQSRLGKVKVVVVGAGAIGSFTALTIAKMGVKHITIYDEDGVNEHNLPNQFYRTKDIKQFKVRALMEIIQDFTRVSINPRTEFYKNQKLEELVIVGTDSMASRKLVWEQFKKQKQSKYFIDARMGGLMGRIYIISKSKEDIKFYEATLYSDKKAVQERCTAKAIIFSINMITSLIARGVASIVNKEKYFPREHIFYMDRMTYLKRN